ncbi:MAG: McrC family protein [Carboxylicivirga sp.]|jgi:5-methylcytosine-specific restriction enzyme subunit McrC|nr:McrC family protein [Carboxylicivirga sp.]
MEVFETIEHSSFESSVINKIKDCNLDFSYKDNSLKYVGLDPNLCTSYFIGIDWLVENKYAIKVNPKIEGLDVMQMFQVCLHTPILNNALGNIYHIELDSPPIETNHNSFNITPMLLIHFLSVVKKIAANGLKRDYTIKDENLTSKIKGKIKFSKHFNHNISKGRYHKNYCNFQEYSINCLENQLLKKTLLFVASYFNKYNYGAEILNSVNYCLSAFENVSYNVDAVLIKAVRINPTFKEYAEALKLAKMILKRFAYTMAETTSEDRLKTPPYWIDMSLLFEIYVYGKLREEFGSTIIYQAKGRYGNADFLKLDEKVVIDTKYKLLYNNPHYDIENVRQLSGYARDINIRKKLKTVNMELLPCCIIYPKLEANSNFCNRHLLEEPIPQFEKFWKIGISLPAIAD